MFADINNQKSALYGFDAQCKGLTKSGIRCSRDAPKGEYCFQHVSTTPIKKVKGKILITKSPVESNSSLRRCASMKANQKDQCSRLTDCMYCWQHGYYKTDETERTCGYKFAETDTGALKSI